LTGKAARAEGSGLAAGIECGGEFLSVALVRYRCGDEAVEFETIDAMTSHRGHRHADVVLGELATMLEGQGLGPDALDLVTAGRGPGGFTGIRVGLATAQGLAFGLGIPLWPVCSLQCLALNARDRGGVIAPMIDAKRSEIYGAAYRIGRSGALEILADAMVGDPHAWVARLQELSAGQSLHILGSGALAYGLGEGKSEALHRPNAALMTELALAEWIAAGRPSTSLGVDPVYLRRSDAEIDYERRHGQA
jgi:tRNA threonylcarbamoyl adenosine modification protein YeaZ